MTCLQETHFDGKDTEGKTFADEQFFFFSPNKLTIKKLLEQNPESALLLNKDKKKMNVATEKKCMNLRIVAANQASFTGESKSEMTLDVIILESKQADQILPGTAHSLHHCKMHFNHTTTHYH